MKITEILFNPELSLANPERKIKKVLGFILFFVFSFIIVHSLLNLLIDNRSGVLITILRLTISLGLVLLDFYIFRKKE